MKNHKLLIILIVILLSGYYSWLLFGSGDWFYTRGRNASNRAAILKIREAIHLGDGYEEVLNGYWQHAATDLRLYSGSRQNWSVSMPPEVGARQWVLYIDFVDGKVSAVKVRTADGPPANDAPEDVSR